MKEEKNELPLVFTPEKKRKFHTRTSKSPLKSPETLEKERKESEKKIKRQKGNSNNGNVLHMRSKKMPPETVMIAIGLPDMAEKELVKNGILKHPNKKLKTIEESPNGGAKALISPEGTKYERRTDFTGSFNRFLLFTNGFSPEVKKTVQCSNIKTQKLSLDNIVDDSNFDKNSEYNFIITKNSYWKAKKQTLDNKENGIYRNQQQIMSKNPSYKVRANDIAVAYNSLNRNGNWEWLHIIGHGLIGDEANQIKYLGVGRIEVNTEMMFIEYLIPELLEKYKEVNLNIKVTRKPENKAILEHIDYTLKWKDKNNTDKKINLGFNPYKKSKIPYTNLQDIFRVWAKYAIEPQTSNDNILQKIYNKAAQKYNNILESMYGKSIF